MNPPDPRPGQRPPPPPAPTPWKAEPSKKSDPVTADPFTTPILSSGSSWRFAGHEIIRELARGGLGVVFLARHPMLEELRAIKRPLDHAGLDSEMIVERFRREVRAVGRLRHDHVIRAHDAGIDQNGPFLVMEFLDGVPLSTIAQRLGPLPVPLACELTRQAALGLQAAHEARMVHRDIKPSNLMLTRHGSGARVVIIDWGLVKWSDAGEPPGLASTEGRELTLLGTTVGTIGYVSPEQLRAEPHLDSRADLFSLGITLGVLLTAKEARQWSSGLPEAVHRGGESPRIAALRHLRRDLPTGLSTIIGKMIDEFPDRRFSHPQAAADALQRWSQGVTAVTLRQILDANSLAPIADIMPRRPAEADSSPFQNASTVSHPSPGATHNAPMPQRPPLVTAPAAVGSLPLAPIATPSPPVFPVVARPPMPPAPPLPDGHVHRPQLSYWSVIAGYLGLVSLACLPLGPLAIAAGVMGLRQIRVASASAGRVRAWVGIITGVAGSLGLLFVSMVVYVAATKPPEVNSKADSQPPGYWVDSQVPVEFVDSDGLTKTRVETHKRWVTGADAKAADSVPNSVPLALPTPTTETRRGNTDRPPAKPAAEDDLFGDTPPGAKH